jgi:hypothetical protein
MDWSDDRVLAMCSVAELPAIAARAALVVGIVSADEVHDARAALRDHSNVMIVPSDPDGTIPWTHEFFSVVYAPSVAEPTSEMLRVLIAAGTLVLAGGAVQKR